MKTSNVMLVDLTQSEMLEINGGSKYTTFWKVGKILAREIAIQIGWDWLEKKVGG